MCMHVEGQIVHLVERFGTHRALKLFEDGMGQPVVLIVALLVEPLAADVAAEGLEAEVDAVVGIEGGGAVERLATGATLVGLLRGVDDLVTTEGARLAETFTADFTDEGSGT